MMFLCLFSLTHNHWIIENDEKTFPINSFYETKVLLQNEEKIEKRRFIANKRYY